MKYSELIQFEPIESVLQLKDADKVERAEQHAETFVMSPKLRDQLGGIIFRELQFAEPTGDNKGIFIVGNYGTGKTHLMSVISSVCEHETIRPDTEGDAGLEEAMDRCQGQFKVIRITIGGSLMDLRDIVCQKLTEGLADMGIEHEFPPADELVSHEETFQEMMAKLDEQYPGKGLLLVVDELLDYLKTRDQQKIYLDLNFLRELGEFCKHSRFRVMMGVQEALFDNPSLKFAADTLGKVKDRYEQVRIEREDIAAVVSKRLLQKDDQQKARIRDHLAGFFEQYPELETRLEEFVELFPVHPAYFRVFERVHVAEKRQVLKTLSQEMTDMLDREVPDRDPGLVTFETYFEQIRRDQTLRTKDPIRPVMDIAETLHDKIEHGIEETYREPALRVCQALAIHRLTTPDIRDPIGLTPEELLSYLHLAWPESPEQNEEFLVGNTEITIRKIRKVTSGKFVSRNDENGQYYIDVDAGDDYDHIISERTSILSDDKKDAGFFEALRQIILEDPSAEPYVRGYNIWEEGVLWPKHHVERPGYLFFGAPNQRSNAQPERDFYLYFLQLFNRPDFNDEEESDEVFFDLKEALDDEGFVDPLLRFAAATELQQTQTRGRSVYRDKADEARKELVAWLKENMPSKCYVTWKGETRLLKEWQATAPTPGGQIRDVVRGVASTCLTSCFEDRYDDYPSFDSSALPPVGRNNLDSLAKDALKHIPSQNRPKHAAAVLEGLELLDDEDLRPRQSRYAQPVIDALDAKTQQEVLNRKELMDPVPKSQGEEVEHEHNLEPELFGVVLGALCYHGDIVLAYQGDKVNASNFGALQRKRPTEVGRFKHIERPKGLPVPAVQELCRLFSVNPQLATSNDEATLDSMVVQIQQGRKDLVHKVVKRLDWVRSPPTVWEVPVVSSEQSHAYEERLSDLKEFLDSLQAYDTPAKLDNFPIPQDEIQEHARTVKLLKRLEAKEEHAGKLGELTKYLQSASLLLPEGHEWQQGIPDLKADVITTLQQDEVGTGEVRSLEQRLTEAKQEYQEEYVKLHKRARLTTDGERRQVELLNSDRLARLRQLAKIKNLVDANRLTQWTDDVSSLKACQTIVPSDLQNSPQCPISCGFSPAKDRTSVSANDVDQLEIQLEEMEATWAETLHSNLQDETIQAELQQNPNILDADKKEALDTFLDSGELPRGEHLETFVTAAMELSEGLQVVEISMQEVRGALVASGSATKPGAVKERFKELLDERTKGTSPDRVRIVFTEETNRGDV